MNEHMAAPADPPYTSGVVLYRFHALLVACGVLFCLGFAAYEGLTYGRRAAQESLWIAIFFTAAGLALGGYLWWFVRKNLRA